MDDSIEKFDEKLESLANERLKISVDANFMDLYLLQLHQELIVLKDFELREDSLTDNVNNRIEELLDIQDLIKEVNNTIDIYKKEIIMLEEEAKKITAEFFQAINDNKFYDFLRKIFKKKYKPPKVRNPDGNYM